MLLYKYWFMTNTREVVFYACELRDAQQQFQETFGYEAPELLRRENW